MMQKLLITLFTTLSLGAIADDGKEIAYHDIFSRQEDIHQRYRNIYERLTDINQQESLKTWYRLFFKTPGHSVYYSATVETMGRSILGTDYRQLLYYYSVTGQKKQAAQTVGLYFLSLHTLIENFIQDPQSRHWNTSLVDEMSRFHQPYRQARKKIAGIEICYSQGLDRISRDFNVRSSFIVNRVFLDCVNNNPWVQNLVYQLRELFFKNKYQGAPFPVSFAGFVGGNQVTLHNRLPRQREDILDLGNQLDLFLNAKAPGQEKLYKDLSLEELKSLMPIPEAAIDTLFTAQEGFRNTINYGDLSNFTNSVLGPWAGRNLGMYGEMIQAIRDARSTVFIDIFWMGGTIGMNLAKELMSKVIEDPNFSVYVITDDENKFNYGTQLDLVYNYMRAFSEKFTDKNFYITPTQINLKRTALPEFADLLITQNVVDDLSAQDNIKSLLKSDGFNLLAKSDHSKVLIVDGKDPHNGRAFVGSKNWTDSSGGVNEDEVAEVIGPATAVLLNSFYYDLFEAFELDLNPKLGGQMVRNHIAAKFPRLPDRQAIRRLLDPVDVLSRTSDEIKPDYVERGDSVVAPAQNNIYGTEMSALEQNIQLILSAKYQILIDDQFLYDPKVVNALKTAMQQNHVKVYILLDSLISFPKNELGEYQYTEAGDLIYDPSKGVQIPNNLFLPELTESGAEIRAYRYPKTVVKAVGDDRKAHDHPIMSMTFHLKSLSVDGVRQSDFASCNQEAFFAHADDSAAATVSGSANKDIMTMSGGFREFQIASYDHSTVAAHDCLFWARWTSFSIPSNGLEFDLPEQALQLGIEDRVTFLNLIRQIVFSTYNFTKELF